MGAVTCSAPLLASEIITSLQRLLVRALSSPRQYDVLLLNECFCIRLTGGTGDMAAAQAKNADPSAVSHRGPHCLTHASLLFRCCQKLSSCYMAHADQQAAGDV